MQRIKPISKNISISSSKLEIIYPKSFSTNYKQNTHIIYYVYTHVGSKLVLLVTYAYIVVLKYFCSAAGMF